MNIRKNKTEETLLVRLAASYVAREANRNTLITPTRAELSPSRTHATIFVSVFPDDSADRAIEFLNRHRNDFFEYVKKGSRFYPVPGVRFEFDYGEKNRQNLDKLSLEIEKGE